MAIHWAMYRDTLIVDQSLADELEAEIAHHDLAAGTTLLLAARVIRHADGFVLRQRGHPLVILTERYEGNGGAIDTGGAAGASGAKGASGTSWTSAHKGRSGGPGADGTPGGAGGAAHPLTLIAIDARDVRLLARGGDGGAGGAGGNGGKAGPGTTGVIGKFNGIPPGNGGAGGDGGKGGNGGPGALVTFRSLRNEGAPVVLDGHGGKAGSGGAAGAGGKGGFEGDGAPGKDGAPGTGGAPGVAGADVAAKRTIYTRVTEWWAAVAALLGNRVDDWADHRSRVGEYHFRRHRPRVPSRVSLRALARHEFLAALRLQPSHAEARLLLAHLDQRLSPIGIPYDEHPVPDFPRYEDVLTDYGPMVLDLFGVASDLLVHAADVADNRGRLAAELAHINALPTVLQADLQAAQVGVTVAQGELELAESRLQANEARIEAAKQAIEDAEMSFEDQVLGTVGAIAIAVVSIAGAFYSGGATLAGLGATVDLLVDVGEALSEGTLDAYGNYQHSTAGDLSTWVDLGAKGGPALTPKAKEVVGGLKDLAKNAKAFYDKVQTVAELFDAEVDGEEQSQYKELLIAHLELTMARNVASLQTLRQGLEVDAVEQRLALAAADAKQLDAHAATLAANIAQLAGISRALIRQAQGFADVLIKYWFLAARAVDAWTTTTEWSHTFSFAYGYLHPDREEHAYAAADRGDGSRLLDLLGGYLQSWGTLPGLVAVRADYEDHTLQLEPHRAFASVSDPQLLTALRDQGSVTIAVDAVPADHDAPKVDSVYVALVGATAAFPNVEVDVEHPGERWGPRPASAPVQATFAADDLEPVPDAVKLRFWGRRPDVLWRLSIDTATAASGQLDLTALSEVVLTVDYRSA